ncbi:hypothetical protein LTR56_004572 [Elasticomyces elasticus]|nr:hypothetical protein LTR56_004572 [Elasticomyces elasticus]KAK3659908.1 hypothetical protein LTR22_008275 [Elasticomyces elasticus]KAK4925911.1 hypothetical protein LTR49_007049 [Elasticomyces elasticus]KAK5768148.1 hypothetical protein LTS12_001632 [Elasticomyces elasticus]
MAGLWLWWRAWVEVGLQERDTEAWAGVGLQRNWAQGLLGGAQGSDAATNDDGSQSTPDNSPEDKLVVVSQPKHAVHSQARQQRQSPLLSLAPEIRNLIYEYTLLEPTKIDITPSYRTPGFLSTCRLVRQEATAMYWNRNHWTVYAPGCDVSLAIAFVTHFGPALMPKPKKQVRLQIGIGGANQGANWVNLMSWCRHVWGGGVLHFNKENVCKMHGTCVVVGAALAVALRHRGRKWEECEEALEGLRWVAALSNKAWGQ